MPLLVSPEVVLYMYSQYMHSTILEWHIMCLQFSTLSVLMVSLTVPEINLCLQKNSLWKLHRHLSTVNALSMDAIHLEDQQLETRPF